MSPFRLIHISDIHLAPFKPPTLLELCNKRITGWLNWKFHRTRLMGGEALKKLIEDIKEMRHDHLIISGDLVNLSLPQEFTQARLWLENLGDPQNVSLIVGNHDAYVPGAFKKFCQIFSPWISGDSAQSPPSSFPYYRVRDEIVIIGVNSAQPTRPFSAKGYFKYQQAAQLANILATMKAKGMFRVVAIHHPPIHDAVAPHKALQNIDLFQKIILEQGAELILHGHSHLPSLNFIAAPNHINVPVVGVASASQACGGHKPAANYNLFEIKKCEGKWHCTLIRRTLVEAQDRPNYDQIKQTQRQILIS